MLLDSGLRRNDASGLVQDFFGIWTRNAGLHANLVRNRAQKFNNFPSFSALP